MKIAIGCDHIVTPVKDEIVKWLTAEGYQVIDKGTYDQERTHYPIYGHLVGIEVAQGNADFGIVICGTGVGISNGAQKTKGTRTILCRDVETAINARTKYNANVIGFGGRITGVGLIQECINAFITTKFDASIENKALIKQIDSLITHENYDLTMFDAENIKWACGEYHD